MCCSIRLPSFLYVLAVGLALFLGLGSGCGGGPSAEIQVSVTPPLSPQVGVELGVPLHAFAGGQAIEWSWRSMTNPMLATRKRRPTLTAYTGGTAVWRWQPIAEDVGFQEIAFFARAGGAEKGQTITFEIGEGEAPPIFREPIGEGTTLDLTDPRFGPCAKVNLVIESAVATMVTLSANTDTENVMVKQTGEFTGELSFCPSMKQRMEEKVYPIPLVALPDKGPQISKVYVIVLRT